MSVIVKGIDVPSDCDGCWHPTCNLWHQTDVGKRHKDCPISPMPEKHGRLIDADDFSAVMKDRQLESAKWLREAKDAETRNRADAVFAFLCEVKLTIGKLPTIVEAEG